MPTARPRYTFTDTGELERLLNAAQHLWPTVSDRRLLLLRLVEEGGKALGLAADQLAAEERRARTHAALRRVRDLVEVDVLASDEAWR
jgi:hypothetical protein